MATPFLIKLKSVSVTENGTMESNLGYNNKSLNGLVARLHYPNAGKPVVLTTRTFSLVDEVELDFTTKDMNQQILFKEEILREAYLEIEITSKEKANKITSFLVKLLSVAVAGAIKKIPGGEIVTGMVTTVSDPLIKLITPKDKTSIVGRFFGEVSEAETEGEYSLDLKVPKKVKFWRYERTPTGEEEISVTLQKDQPNGFVKISFDKL